MDATFLAEPSKASLSNVTWLVAIFVPIFFFVSKALYNISPWHSLSRFPGPKIAAATYLYEALYDWVLVGQYGNRIAEMHQRYGPVVRISPDELHCNDPKFLDTIYSNSTIRMRDKWQHQLNTGGVGPVSATGFSTIGHEQHRKYRKPLEKFFGRDNVRKMESDVLELTQATIRKMLNSAREGPFNVKQAFDCFTADVVSQCAFGKPMGFVAQAKWTPNFGTWVEPFFRNAYKMRHNILARMVAQAMPFIANFLSQDFKIVMETMTITIPGYIHAALENPKEGKFFTEMMGGNKSLSKEDEYRFIGEGFNLLLAGTETTAGVLTILTYWLLTKPAVHIRLMSDLSKTGEKWAELERCPYFWATIQESLRMMPGVSHRSARIAREEDLLYQSSNGKIQYLIPRGTPISMTSMIHHWNESIFPDPNDFNPGRWILPDGKPNRTLENFSIAFGKGTRSCVGRNLALCELFVMGREIILSLVPRVRLVNTEKEDIAYHHDLIVYQTVKGSVSVCIVNDDQCGD